MRKTKLDRRCSSTPTIARLTERSASSEAARHHGAPKLRGGLLVLRRAVQGNGNRIGSWPVVLLRIAAQATAMVVVTSVAVLWITSHPRHGDAIPHHPPQCINAFAAQAWREASIACAREADETGDSALGVRGARALFTLASDPSEVDEALRSALRWFGSNDDATARQVAGAACDKRGEPALAISLLQRALTEHRRRGDHEETARDEGYLAGTLMHQGLLGDAFEAAKTAVQEADLTRSDDAHAQIRGQARLKLGKILVEIGDFSTAETTFVEAGQALGKWPADKAWVFLQLGMLLQAREDHANAAAIFEQALELARRANVAQVTASARLNLAREKRELGELDAAELQMNQLDESTRNRSTARFVEALIAADRGRRKFAEELLAQAAARAPTDDYAMDIALERGRLAERASDMTAAEQYYRAAISIVEKLRRETNSLEWRPYILARRRVPYRLLLSLLARQDRRDDALVITEQLHARTWLDALVERTGATGVRAQLSSALSLGRRLQADAASAPSADDLHALLRTREVLVFSEIESDIWRFHIIDGAVAQLDHLPDQTRLLVKSWQNTPNNPPLAVQLGALLIPPSVRAASHRPLYIVTNGDLDTLPFAALRPGGRFLIKDRVISRLPGIVALQCRTRRESLQSSVLLGDSRGDLAAARKGTIALANTLRVTANMLRVTAFVGADATVERLVAARDAELLHLAIHAEVDQAGGRLLLANQKQVTVADIVEHTIGPRVAVLAGCATAVAPNAEEWGALSSAFLAAGSRSVVATLWSVKDRDAMKIMRRFYALGGAQQPALALAKAQRELLAAAKPSAWAPFTIYGSADAADCESSP